MLSVLDRFNHLVIGPSGRARSNRQRLIRRLTRPAWLGTLRRTTPLSCYWGYDRGTPIDRYYIENFLDERHCDIRGRVLEVKNSDYTRRFGTNVERSDVVDIDPANPQATIVVNLAAADSIPADTFDCMILTQTLQYIYHPQAAMAHACRILRPGGVLLMTVPGIIKMDPDFVGIDYWRFTVDSCAALVGEVFGAGQIKVRTYGNVLTAIAFLTGLAHEELSPRELDSADPAYPVVIAVRTVKSGEKVARS
jgi:SAM-dependent methyltransferase